MFNWIVCFVVGHNIVRAGACPFTGKDYDVCKRCTQMFEVYNDQSN
jgi:hypothetical protein